MPCDTFKFDEITPELLQQRTEACALQLYHQTKNADSLHNWIEGKKLVAFTIVDSYGQNCMATSKCLPLPNCCYEYLEEISIQDVKKFKAYFIWEGRGNNKEQGNYHVSDYEAAYNEIIPSCAKASENATDCLYLTDVLFVIEKRRNIDRRGTNNSTSEGTIRITRLNGNRRKTGRINIIDEFLRNNSLRASQRLTA
jgi:hypothetical protein